MAQQIELQRQQSAYDREGLQQLQQELDQENINLQRMTSTEERADRQKMRRIFNSVRLNSQLILVHCICSMWQQCLCSCLCSC